MIFLILLFKGAIALFGLYINHVQNKQFVILYYISYPYLGINEKYFNNNLKHLAVDKL